jgi:hypothetical protein
VLTEVEEMLRIYPYQWFNFEGLNPEASEEQGQSKQHAIQPV